MDKVLYPFTAIAHQRERPMRIFELDFLRGFAVFLMVLIHSCYTLGFGPKEYFGLSFNEGPEWLQESSVIFRWIFCAITQPQGTTIWNVSEGFMNMNTNLYCLEIFFAGTFMFLAGISCSLSKSNFKRGFQCLYLANLMSLVLEVASDIMVGSGNTPPYGGIHIWCGILHAIGIALLSYSIFDHFFKKWWQTYAGGVVLAIVSGFVVWFGYKDGRNLANIYPMVDNASDFFANAFSLLVGLKRYGDDCFSPLLVTTAVFLGATVGKTLYKNKRTVLPSWFKTGWGRPICFLGKHALIIYLSHQLLITLLLGAVMMMLGYGLAF